MDVWRKSLAVSLGMVAAALLIAEARAEDFSLDARLFFSPDLRLQGSPLDCLFGQDGVIEETHRQRVVGESPPPEGYVERSQRREMVGQYSPRYNPERPGQLSIRAGWLLVSHALDERPTNVMSMGLCLRAKLPPEGLHMVEVCIDSSVDRMELDILPGEESFYQEYFDMTFSFLGYFQPRHGPDSPVYWGVGVGYSKETFRLNYTDTSRSAGYPGAIHGFNESGIFQLKLGWDSGRNFYAEVAYKKLFDSERNLDQLFNVTFGVCF